MGMFDYYIVKELVKCQICKLKLSDFQGKDAANALFVWHEGERHPVNQCVAEESLLHCKSMKEFNLPKRFKIYSYCKNNHLTELECELNENFKWNKIYYKK